MLATKKQEPAKAKTDSPKEKAGPGQEASPEVEINPVWQSLAVQVPMHSAVGASDEPPPIQRKSLEGAGDEEDELEADRAAERVMRVPAGESPTSSVQETTRAATTTETSVRTLIVDDDVEGLQAGQVRKSEFLERVRVAVCEAVEPILASAGRTTADCPYLNFVFDFAERRDAAYAERTLRDFAPDLRDVSSADAYIPRVVERVSQSARNWVRTGEITGLPEGIPRSFLSSTAREEGGTTSAASAVQPKARSGGARLDHSPRAVLSQLGPGRPLDSDVASRMGSAFGTDFSHVRQHDDARGARLSADLNARAFTVGEHVAFGTGEYRPGTPVGDALIAHELAHVEQQKGAKFTLDAEPDARGAEYDEVEKDADDAAISAMERIRGVGAALRGTFRTRLRSGLSLRRCSTPIRTEQGHTRAVSNVTGRQVGVWRRATDVGAIRHDLIAGELILRPGSEQGTFEDSFDNADQAAAYAHVVIAARAEDGGVIIRENGRYRVFVIDVDPSRLLFSRYAIEEDMSTSSLLDTSGSQVGGVVAFISTDGYRVPINQEIKLRPNRLVPTAIPTQDIGREGYEQVLSDIRSGRDLNIGGEGYLALFKGMLRANALRQLDENKRKLDEEQATYGTDQSSSSIAWRRLRAIIRKDQALARHEEDAHRNYVTNTQEAIRLFQQTAYLSQPSAIADTSRQAAESRRQAQRSTEMARTYREQEEQIKQYRARLRTEYPPLSTLDTGTITPSTGNEQIFARIRGGFDEIRTLIDDVKQRIHSEDIPLSKLGAIVDQTKRQMGITESARQSGDPLSAAALEWLDDQDTTEAIITWTGTILSLVLGVAAIIASGGTAIFLGLAGSAVGLGTAVYEFERAEDLYAAAQAGEATGGNLVADPEAARFNYIMGWVNLVLAGLDLGIAARAASTVWRGGRIAEELAGSLGGDVLRRLRPEQIARFDEAMRLRQAGNAEGAQRILDRLRRQLGDEVFTQAESLFGRAGTAKHLFGSMPGLTDEARRALVNLDEAILNRLPAMGANAVENVGQFISRHGNDAAVFLNRGGDEALGMAGRVGSTVGGDLDDIFRVFSQTTGNLRDQFIRLFRMGDLTMAMKTDIIRDLGEAIAAGRVPVDDLTSTVATITRAGGNADQIALNARQTLSELQNANRVVTEGAEGAVRVNAVANEVYDLGQGVTTTINPMHEIDALFLRGRTIFAHEVKDTVAALLNKLRANPIGSVDNQLRRMMNWRRAVPAGQSRAIEVIVRSENRWTDLFSQVEGRTIAQILGRENVPLRIGDTALTPGNLTDLHTAMFAYWQRLGRPAPGTFFARPELQTMADAFRAIGFAP